MTKKLTSLALALVMCLSLCVPAFAVSTEIDTTIMDSESRGVLIYSTTQAERDKEVQMYMETVLKEIVAARGNLGYSKSEYGTKTTKIVTGYPGKQLSGGYSFGPSGGMVYFTETGGPTKSVSVSVGIPGFGSVGVSIPLGNMTSTTTGYGCDIPGSPSSNPKYYKVYEKRTVEIQPYVAYWRQTEIDPWTVADKGQTVTIKRVRADAILV